MSWGEIVSLPVLFSSLRLAKAKMRKGAVSACSVQSTLLCTGMIFWVSLCPQLLRNHSPLKKECGLGKLRVKMGRVNMGTSVVPFTTLAINKEAIDSGADKTATPTKFKCIPVTTCKLVLLLKDYSLMINISTCREKSIPAMYFRSNNLEEKVAYVTVIIILR